MKTSIFTFAAAAALLLAPAGLRAAETVSSTHFEGKRITGVSASSAFDVVLVKSTQTKAVVELDAMLEKYLHISLDGSGVVEVGLREVNQKVWRQFNQLPDKEKVVRLTLHLPSVNTIRLSGATDLKSSDSFTGENVDIQLSGASDIDKLSISSERVKLQCSGASDASLILPATKDLVVLASGSSDVAIDAAGVTYSKLGVSGASDLKIKGSGDRGDWSASGSSGIEGYDFPLRELTATASGVSSINCNVSESLSARSSGSSDVNYRGDPVRVDYNTSGSGSIRRIKHVTRPFKN